MVLQSFLIRNNLTLTANNKITQLFQKSLEKVNENKYNLIGDTVRKIVYISNLPYF